MKERDTFTNHLSYTQSNYIFFHDFYTQNKLSLNLNIDLNQFKVKELTHLQVYDPRLNYNSVNFWSFFWSSDNTTGFVKVY